MVFKVLIVILTLVVIENNAQHFNRIDIDRYDYDLYKYGFLKNLGLKRDDKKERRTPENLPEDDLYEKASKAQKQQPYEKNSDDNFPSPKPNKQDTRREKKTMRQLGIMDMLRAMPYDPLIYVPEEYEFEDKLEK